MFNLESTKEFSSFFWFLSSLSESSERWRFVICLHRATPSSTFYGLFHSCVHCGYELFSQRGSHSVYSRIVFHSIIANTTFLFSYLLFQGSAQMGAVMRGEQTLRLIQLYHSHYPEIARNTQDADGRKLRTQLWQIITDELNAAYQTSFSVEQYKKKIQNVQCTSRQKAHAGKR